MAAISIGSGTPAAASAAKASATKGFDSVMAGLGHAAHEADASSQEAADARAAEKADQDDADRNEAKRDRAKDDSEDPAALLALANSVAAITRGDAAAGAAKTAASAVTAAATPSDATAQPVQPTAAETPPDSSVLPALPTMVQPAPARPLRSTLKTTIDAATTSTADILAARAAKVAPIAASDGDGKDAADGGDGDGKSAPDPTFAAMTAAAAPSPTVASVSATGGDVLAAGGADRQLDLAKGDAWLDGLARDIASTADSGGTLRFQLSPPALGNLHVELTRGDDGTAVKMTAATIDAQAILADARPRLIESAHAHGVHISEATVGLGGAGTSTDGQNRDPSGDNGSNPSRTAAATDGSGGNADGQAQTRSQNEPDLYHGARRQGMTVSAPTGGARQDLDAGYA